MSRRTAPATETTKATDDVVDEDDDLRDLLGMSPRRAPAMLSSGQVIDDAYRIEEELGAGGMGRVYRARDLKLGRDVALKLHAVALAPDDDSLRREAIALARLTHPNVVTVYGVGAWSGHPWVAMEYVPGGNARSWLTAAPRSAREILTLYLAAGRGLSAAHAAGLVHRDFKPDNVLVGRDGRARVADFGLAREVASEPSAPEPRGSAASTSALQTRSGFARGTPAYMAPEQRAGGVVDAAADQFAFAIALWEALSGARPFPPPTEDVIRGAEAIVAPPAGTLPRHVELALRRALASDPRDRWPSMDALLAELARDPVRRRRRMLTIAAAGLAVAAGGFAVAHVAQDDRREISCAPTSDDLAEIWSPSRRDALRSTLGASADRVLALVDAWTTRWHAQRQSACEATHVDHLQSPELLDVRTACLDRAHIALAATLDLIAAQPPGRGRALEAATALPHLEDCADLTLLTASGALPTTPTGIASSSAAAAMLARARALNATGPIQAALAASREAVAFADAIRIPVWSAQARVELATAIFSAGKLEGVLETFEEAARFAAEAKDDALAAQIWINVLDAIGLRLDKPGDAERLMAVAEAAVARAGASPMFDGYLAGIRGDLAVQRQSFAAAIPLLEQRIRAAEQRFGKSDPSIARWLNRLATAHAHLHHAAEARASLDRAATILEAHYGPTHVNLGVLLTTRGILEYQAGDYAAAIATNTRALEIKEAALGANHPGLIPTLMNLGLAHSELGAHEVAIAAARRALLISEAALPTGHPKLGFALTTLGQLLVAAHEWDHAAPILARALAILEPLGDHAPLDETLRAVSSLRLHANDLHGARSAADRAAAIAIAEYGSSLDAARALAQVGRVQRAAHDLAGARASYQRAVELVAAAAGDTHPDAVALANELATLAADPLTTRR